MSTLEATFSLGAFFSQEVNNHPQFKVPLHAGTMVSQCKSWQFWQFWQVLATRILYVTFVQGYPISAAS